MLYVQPVGAANVKVYGPAVEAPVTAYTVSYLIVDCKEAGPGLSYLLTARVTRLVACDFLYNRAKQSFGDS